MEIIVKLIAVLFFLVVLSIGFAYLIKMLIKHHRNKQLDKELDELAKANGVIRRAATPAESSLDPKPWWTEHENQIKGRIERKTGKAPELAMGYGHPGDIVKLVDTDKYCPRCGADEKTIQPFGVIHCYKCERCGQRYKSKDYLQNERKRWDRNAVQASPAAPSADELRDAMDTSGHWPGVIIMETKENSPGFDPDRTDFGGGDFGGSGAGDSYDSGSDFSSSDSGSDSSSSND